ncbi:hypothetical protein LRX75_08245 [Rhizobium sp. DKSPLA3]|uniref:Uncharacterized protein n=1 Tax=Rhizobium quercicola TaxID=2901226 RepID=A0A9X1T044_9HYPH|nr:hypothetical protein [Rhizobium quercicola]MCD7109032.1 hypothetical protein [Rhizobium quercicola]
MQGQGLMIVIDALGIELDALKREVLRLRAELAKRERQHLEALQTANEGEG